MVENVPLARALAKSMKIGQAIPIEHYQAVAEVLAALYNTKRGNKHVLPDLHLLLSIAPRPLRPMPPSTNAVAVTLPTPNCCRVS